MSQSDEKFRKVTKSTSEEKTTSSESTETRDSAAGHYEKRIVENETFERRTKHSEVFESGCIRTEQESTHVEGPSGGTSSASALPASPKSGPPVDWSSRVPRRLKFMLRGCTADSTGPKNAADLDGDFILDLALRDDRRCVWDLNFLPLLGFYKVKVSCRPIGAGLNWEAELEGLEPGPAWGASHGAGVPAQLVLELKRPAEGNPLGGIRWPHSVKLVAVDEPSRMSSPLMSSRFDLTAQLGAGSCSCCSSSGSSGYCKPCPPIEPPCDEPDPADCCDECPCTTEPVRYFDGLIRLTATDLQSSGFGASWRHTRVYSNQMSSSDDLGQGFNWLVQQWAYLVPGANGSVTIVRGNQGSLWFDRDGGSYVGRFGTLSTLEHDVAHHLFVLRFPDGTVMEFHDLNQLAQPMGMFSRQIEPGGAITRVVDYTVGDLIGEIQRTGTAGGETLTEAFVYEYTVNLQLETVTLRRQLGTSGWEDVRRAAYDYYDGSTAFGSAADLQRARLQVPTETDWADTQVSYYRYYKSGDAHGFAHCLRYVVKPATYAKMVAASVDPLTVSNGVLSTFADNYFEFDEARRVTLEQVDGGSRTYEMSFTVGTASLDFNVWAMKTVETLPDGNQNIVYSNRLGQYLIKELLAGTDRWIDAFHYDSAGREVWHAHPSAVVDYDDEEPDLEIELRTNDGLIEVTDYYASTGAGAAEGYVAARKLKQGGSGTPITLEELSYDVQSAGGSTVYPIASQTVYRNDNGTGGIETSYDYSYYSGTTQIKQKTTTLPVIPTEQNGSGVAATRMEYFDERGRLTWSMDERGYITHFEYDLATGAQILRIDDVNTSVVEAPTGWTTPGDGGLNLFTDSNSDDQGRVIQTLWPAHEIDIAGTATTIRRASWTVFDDENHITYSGQGYASGSAPDYDFTLINPVAITKRDADGKVLEQVQAVAAETEGTLEEIIADAGGGADAFPQSSYTRWTTYQYTDCCVAASQRVYHTIPTSGEGSSGTNYDETVYGYDIMKRRDRTVTPGGTITDLVFDPRGLTIGQYVGTNDDGATEQDPTGGGLDLNNNMVVITAYEFDGGDAGGDGNVTGQTQHVNAIVTRVTNFGYDFRSRRIWTDGEIDFYQEDVYDNLNRIVQSNRYDTTVEGNLIGRNEALYDDQNRVFRTIRYGVDPTTGTIGNELTDNTWYDSSGHVIKSQPSGSQLFTKTEYDSLGRSAISYNGYDLDEASYGEIEDIDDDVILTQSETLYDHASNAIQMTRRQRYHNAPDADTGPLEDPSHDPRARVTYSAAWPDALGRSQASANYGTNGGTDLSRPDTIPARSDDVLVDSTDYDSAGNVLQSVDPSGMARRFEYNAVGRPKSEISNYVESPSEVESDDQECDPSSDTNVTVLITYNADGKLETLTAVNSATGDQITTYVYGTTLDDSDIASSLLLRKEIYPDSEDQEDVIQFNYNRQQQMTQVTDQGGTIHQFDYDLLGRQTQDRVTALGTDVDDTVLRIETTYEVRGMHEHLTSYDDPTAGTGTIVNDCLFVYNDFSLLLAEYQSHDGAVDTDTTPKVQYEYADGSANTVRQTELIYPNGRQLHYSYGDADKIDDASSRVASLIDDDGTTQLADYSYLGQRMFVVTDYIEAQTKLTLVGTTSGNDPDTGDIYRGLDRFGRIKDSYWYNYGDSSDTDRIKYGYDRVGNRLWRENVVATAESADFDELYQYDQVHRLKHMDRGTLNGPHTGMSATTFAQCWTLDETGNWNGFRQDDDGNATWDLIQSRTANPVNEISDISESTGPTWIVPEYSPTGNMATMPQPAVPTGSYTATYDAWNRLMKLVDGLETISEYQYDGARRRVTQVSTSGSFEEVRHFYYTEPRRWQDIEERVGTSASLAITDRHFVWGMQYSDDCVLRDRDNNSDGILDERQYIIHDGNWNVVAISNDSGTVQERYAYSAYGMPLILSPSFSPRISSVYSWNHLYAGYFYEETTGLYHVRWRTFNPLVGCWLQRDLVASVNQYEYGGSKPLRIVDPSGNVIVDVDPAKLIEYIDKNDQDKDGCYSVNFTRFLSQDAANLGIKFSPEDLSVIIQKGCIGVTMGQLTCPGSGSPTTPPHISRNTTCFPGAEGEAKAKAVKCRKLDDGTEGRLVVFAMMGTWKGGSPPKVGKDGSIDPSSLEPLDGPNGGQFNFVTMYSGIYIDMNFGRGLGKDPNDPQIIRFCKNPPKLGDQFPNMMWCGRCHYCVKKTNTP